ncbi:PhoU domain-containing protein, partial [Halomonas sp. 707D4]|uniref:phosphate signaling complex PhoU family protein n=1 Tax=Halomonas sp. 707D4 TaxID=1904455 RepID=UPI002646D8DC
CSLMWRTSTSPRTVPLLSLSDSSGTVRGLVEVRHISEHVRKMLRDALTAFARFDTELAMQVVREDESVDDEYGSAMRSLMTFMMEDSRSITSVLSIMWILRALERVGDHANNLAEYVVYLVKGLDIRHSAPERISEQVQKKP